MEEERQEEQEQRAMAVQAGARCRLGDYLGWLAQDLVSQRLLFSSGIQTDTSRIQPSWRKGSGYISLTPRALHAR